ncbi:tetratricopeptide repeat-containing sensor histidine kinase [Algoriphagus sp.]|uniref:tetratricopeptide repeat-containing sensor histidine kinase n=1 Tax=Algoriphagus sp. TaxID=1872435 RepID=UPI0025EBD428|nr:tetratricopeptide repeat-containing sensor histidine kinase [Algoriphagus sp.]
MKRIRHILVVFLIFSWFHESKSQSVENVDSLKSALSDAEGPNRIDILNLLATNLRESEQELALSYALQAELLAHSLQDIAGESLAKENIGWIFYRRGKWLKSFEYTADAYELAIQSKDNIVAARLLNSMGALYYEQNNFALAIEHFKKAYAFSKEEGDLYTEIRSLNNVAFNFSQMKEYDSALYYANYSIQLNKKSGSPYLTAFANRVVGDVYFNRGQYDSAAIIFQSSLEDSRTQKVKSTEASVIHRLGATYLKLGKLDEAEKILKEGVKVSEENKFLDELAKSHKYLSQVYEAKGDLINAFDQQKTYLILNDSLVDKGNTDRIALLQGMFQENLDKSELDLLKAQNENQAQRIKLNRRNNWILGIAIVLILSLLVWLYFLNRNIKRYNKYLLQQKALIKDQNKEFEAKSIQLTKINETKNKLFSILGHDLKGPVGQVKSVVDLLVKGMLSRDEFDQLVKILNKDIDTVYFTLNNTLKWSMSQMEGFRIKKNTLNLSKIVDSTITLIDSQLIEKNISILNSMPEKVKVYADSDLMEVVIRNILNNAVKFSKRNEKIEISVSNQNHFVKWCVLDHGIGMTKDQIKEILGIDYAITNSQQGTDMEKGSGLGLQLCKEFIRMNGGEIFIESTIGKGTKICVTIPEKDLTDEVNTLRNKEFFQS